MTRATRLLALAATMLWVSMAAGAAPLTRLRIGVPERDNLQFLTLWTALGSGCFEREGIEPQLVVADAPNRGGELLLQHQVDVALLQRPVLLELIGQQQPIVQVATLAATTEFATAHPDVIAAVTRAVACAEQLLHSDPAPAASTPVFDLGVVNVTAAGTQLAPAVDTLDRANIEAHQARTVDRAIGYLPGVTVDHKSPRNQTGISVGGFDTRQVPLYLDGIPAYVPFDGYVDLSRYLTADVGEIQVAKGYSSPLLGPNVMGGVINIVSRQPQRRLEGDALIGTAPGSLLESGMHVGSRQRRYFAQASADRLQSDFFPVSHAFAFTATQPRLDRTNSAQQDQRYRLRAGWTPRARDSYVLSYSNQDGAAGVPPYSGSAPVCTGGATTAAPCVTPKYWKWPEWNTDSLSFNSNTALGSRSDMQLRAFYVRYANVMDMFDDAAYSTMNGSAASGSTRNRDHSLGLSGEFDTHAIARNTLGASFFVKNDTHTEETTTFSAVNAASTSPLLTDADRQASFGIHDAYTLSPHVTATAGFSADQLNGLQAPAGLPTDHLWAYNPVGSISFASQRAGTLFVAYAHKSRFPTLKDRYSYKAGRALPNPLLHPERAQTWTVGYSRAFAARTMAQVDVFHSSVGDEIENISFVSPLCGGGGGRGAAGTCQQAVNVGGETHDGVTISLHSSPLGRVAVDGNYSFLHRDISGTPGVFPTGTPTHKAVATASLLVGRGATAIVSAEHQAGIAAMSDNGLPLPAATFTVVDIAGQIPFRAGLRLQAGVRNLLDRDYYYWEGFPEQGRNAYITLRFAF